MDIRDTVRYQIVDTFSRWTAFSSTRSGCPLKSRADIYPLLDLADFEELIKADTEITKEKFDGWHQKSSTLLNKKQPKMPVGWTTKLINVYLKTMVYVGNLGPSGLVEFIHPPIDNGLINGLKESFGRNETLSKNINFKTLIKDIKTYKDYSKIITAIELVANAEGCLLIEVEQFWQGTRYKMI